MHIIFVFTNRNDVQWMSGRWGESNRSPKVSLAWHREPIYGSHLGEASGAASPVLGLP